MIYSYIKGLVNYAISKNLILESDTVYATNRVLALLKLDDYKDEEASNLELHELLNEITNYAISKNLLNDSITERDIFDTEIMAIFTDRPSNLIKKYNDLYEKDPILATNWYYDFSVATNYIRKDRIKKDVKWKTSTEYGELDITINLSKPEKDPKDIARQKDMPKTNYPVCLLCKENEAMDWYNKMWQYTVEFFRSLDVPVRTLECCSGDLADLKVKSCDVEAWSPRQQKFFEVGSCSNLTDAQARRLGIRYKKQNGDKEFAHTLNNTVIAPPRMLIAFLENNLNEDGSVNIPEVLRPYMGGKDKLIPKK